MIIFTSRKYPVLVVENTSTKKSYRYQNPIFQQIADDIILCYKSLFFSQNSSYLQSF